MGLQILASNYSGGFMLKQFQIVLASLSLLIAPLNAIAGINEFTEVKGQSPVTFDALTINELYISTKSQSIAVGTNQHGIYFKDKSDPKFEALPNSKDISFISGIAEFNNTLYLGNHLGLYVYNNTNGKFETVVLDKSIIGSLPVSKMLVYANKLYVATNNGLFIIEGNNKVGTTDFAKKEYYRIYDIAVHSSQVYISTGGGIMRQEGASWTEVFPNEAPVKNPGKMISNGQYLYIITGKALETPASVVQYDSANKSIMSIKTIKINDNVTAGTESLHSIATVNKFIFLSTSKAIYIINTDGAKKITKTENNYFDLVSYKGQLYTNTLNRVYELSLDSDEDGVIDDLDNCLSAKNPDQQNSDGDKLGNVCDADYIAPATPQPSPSVVATPTPVVIATPTPHPTATPLVCNDNQILVGDICTDITPPVNSSGGCSLSSNPVFNSSLMISGLACLLFTALYFRNRNIQK